MHRLLALAIALLLGACAEQPRAPTNNAEAAPFVLDIPAEVLKPAGKGPFPAVVILHDCSGLGPRGGGAPRRWAAKLVDWGYVVILPDSFGTRGFPDGVCTTDANRSSVAPFTRVRDAYDALRHLRSLPYVDGSRVAVMGGSHGGSSTLTTLVDGPNDGAALSKAKHEGFKAGIALYPGCAIGRPPFTQRYKAVAPLLILSGELDDWTPAAPCQKLVEAAAKEGPPVRIKVYPGAHHSFDGPSPVRFVATRNNANAPGGKGATTGGNADAWADSVNEVRDFLARNLAAPRT